jgi:Lectin C-type domain
MKPKTLFINLLLLHAPLFAHADILTGPITNAANGHLYYLLSQNTWPASDAEARTLGSHLVTINDADENRFVTDTFGPTALALGAGHVVSLGIGLSDAVTEGSWVWSNGEPASYTNWQPGQPSAGPDEDFAGIFIAGLPGLTPGKWHDFVPDGRYGDVVFGVVEVAVPVPALTIRVSQVELCWQTVTNTWYQLQYRSSLTTNQWVPLSGTWITGDGARYCTNDAVLVGTPQRFYQLSVTNSPPQ